MLSLCSKPPADGEGACQPRHASGGGWGEAVLWEDRAQPHKRSHPKAEQERKISTLRVTEALPALLTRSLRCNMVEPQEKDGRALTARGLAVPAAGTEAPRSPLLRCQLSLPTASYGIFRGGCRTPSKTPPGFTLHRGPTRSGSRGCKTVSLSHLWLLIFPSLCPPDYLRDLTPPPDITRAHPVVFQPADFSPSCCSPGSLDYSHEITPPLGTNLKRKRFSAFFRN